MKRRSTIKTLLLGSAVAGLYHSCKPEEKSTNKSKNSNLDSNYGRTKNEKAHDKYLQNLPAYFTTEEAALLTILMDIILPSDEKSPAASETGVLDFLQFIVKDMPEHQLPLRAGLSWINREAFNRFGKVFSEITGQEQLSIIDDIAYPFKTKPENIPGEKFFSRLRNLVMTGFYTSKEGLADLNYQGNRANFWDGVPQDILKKHGFTTDETYQDIYITEEKRTQLADWDDAGNLIYQDS